MKKGKNIGVIILAVIVVAFLAKNMIAKSVVETAVRAVAGVKLDLGKLNVGLTNTLVEIKDLNLHNPKGFQDPIMLSMPEIFVDYSLSKIFTGKVHVDEIRVHLKEFLVVKDKDGKLNLDSLKVIQNQKKKDVKKEEKKGEAIKPSDVAIKNLSLKVERVVFKDYSKGDEPKVKEFNLNINENYSDIENLQAVAALIIVKVMTKTTLASLTSFDVTGLSDSVSGALSGATDVAQKAVGEAADTAKKALGGAKDTLKGTTEDLKGLIKNPFGN